MTDILQSYGVEVLISNYAEALLVAMQLGALIFWAIVVLLVSIYFSEKGNRSTIMVPGMIGVAVSVLLVFGKFLSADSTISTGNSIYRIMDMPKFHQQACARYGSVMSAVKELPGLPTFGTQEAKWNEAENTCIIHTTDGTKEDFTAIGHDTLKRVFVFDMKKANKKNNQERLKNAFGK